MLHECGWHQDRRTLRHSNSPHACRAVLCVGSKLLSTLTHTRSLPAGAGLLP